MSKQLTTFQMTPVDEILEPSAEACAEQRATEALMAEDAAALGALVRRVKAIFLAAVDLVASIRPVVLRTGNAG